MTDNLLDPVVLCFILGLIAGISRSDLKLPGAIYDALSIYLLLAIGLKGGVHLAKADVGTVVGPVLATIVLGIVIPCLSYLILRRLGRFQRHDAAAIAAHYGSVSAVTFAVVISYLSRLAVPHESFVAVLLVVLEVPAIAVGIVLAKTRANSGQPVEWGKLGRELLFGKSIFLLLGGLVVGFVAGPARMAGIEPVFFDLFTGALAIFLLEMGLLAAQRLRDLRSVGIPLVTFAIGMPLVSGMMGAYAGHLAGLSVGGATVLATLAASASYIAAPAAMRISVPEANPTYYLVSSIGITFPFNIVIGIPIYYAMATWVAA